jgi:hypothetical protein
LEEQVVVQVVEVQALKSVLQGVGLVEPHCLALEAKPVVPEANHQLVRVLEARRTLRESS